MPNGVPITEFEEAKLQRCGLVSEPCDVPNTNDFAPRARSTSASDNPLRASCTVSGMSFLRVQDNLRMARSLSDRHWPDGEGRPG